MKVLKTESEEVQQIVIDALADLQRAYDKLESLFSPTPKLAGKEAGVSVAYAQYKIQGAVAFLHKEEGEEPQMPLCVEVVSAWEPAEGTQKLRFKHDPFTDF